MADGTRQLPPNVRKALVDDPAFRVLTMDATGWIDPYTGAIVPTPFGHEEVARKHLTGTQPFLTMKPKPLDELLNLRWMHYLRDNLEFVPALRIFRAGLWLNPYNGEWVKGVALENNLVSVRIAEDLARILSRCPEAQSGKMLERWRIETLAAQGPVTAEVPDVAQVAKRPASKAARAKTDFHHVKQMFLKMLARPPRVDGCQLVVHYEPHSQITRDFYDFIPVGPTRLLLVMGDFSGQGPGAAMMAASTLQVLRRLASKHVDLVDLVANLNDEVRCDLFHGCSISLFVALIDLEHNSLTCLSAGHHPALLLSPRRMAAVQHLRTPGSTLGVTTGQPFRKSLVPMSLQLEPGDILLLYSNGVSQMANAVDPDAGRWAVIGQCLANLKRPCAELVANVVEAAKGAASDRQPREDMTVLAMRIKDASWLFEAT